MRVSIVRSWYAEMGSSGESVDRGHERVVCASTGRGVSEGKRIRAGKAKGQRAPAATRQKRRAATCGQVSECQWELGRDAGSGVTARLVDALGVEVCAREACVSA